MHRIKALHDQYGEVVRIAPDELSFVSGKAFSDIYGNKDFQKNPIWIRPQVNGFYSIHGANDTDHARFRRLFSHAFSDKARRLQEPILQSYVDLLMKRLDEKVAASADSKAVIDVGQWYNFVTFDIMGDLCFGESFHCLEESHYHPWVAILFSNFKAAALAASCRYVPGVDRVLRLMLPKSVTQKRRDHFDMIKARVEHRLRQRGTEQKNIDFMAYILHYNDEKGMTISEIEATLPFVIVAGSETTATALAGITNCLVNHPETLQQLVDEIRGSFTHSADMTFEAISKLPFLGAVIDEGLRICAPVALGSPRAVPVGGGTIDGQWLPGGVSLYSVPCGSLLCNLFFPVFPIENLLAASR